MSHREHPFGGSGRCLGSRHGSDRDQGRNHRREDHADGNRHREEDRYGDDPANRREEEENRRRRHEQRPRSSAEQPPRTPLGRSRNYTSHGMFALFLDSNNHNKSPRRPSTSGRTMDNSGRFYDSWVSPGRSMRTSFGYDITAQDMAAEAAEIIRASRMPQAMHSLSRGFELTSPFGDPFDRFGASIRIPPLSPIGFHGTHYQHDEDEEEAPNSPTPRHGRSKSRQGSRSSSRGWNTSDENLVRRASENAHRERERTLRERQDRRSRDHRTGSSSSSRPGIPFFDQKAFLKEHNMTKEQYEKMVEKFLEQNLKKVTHEDETGGLECASCLDTVKPEKLVQSPNCMHLLCHECVVTLFRQTLQNKDLPARCCNAEVPISIIKHLNLLTTSETKQYNDLLPEALSDARTRVYCSNRRCGKWIPPTSPTSSRRKADPDNVTCPYCKTRTCKHCKNASHKNKICEQDEATKALMKMGKDKKWQRCPSCGVMVERNGGCMIMECRCGFVFCIYCGRKWEKCNAQCRESRHYAHRQMERWLLDHPGFE